MSVAFSTEAVSAFETKLIVNSVDVTPEDQLLSKYQLATCASWITDNCFKRVALQFPDHLLVDAVPISLWLQHETRQNIYILADTSYGSCCVDEVAAEHVDADCVVHFGHACLSAICRLPVHYCFPDRPLCGATVALDLLPRLTDQLSDSDVTLVVFCDVIYQHALDDICRHLSSQLPNVVPAVPSQPGADADADANAGCSRLLNRRIGLTAAALSDACILYVGPAGATHSCLCACVRDPSVVLRYDPPTGHDTVGSLTSDSAEVTRLLKRRYYLVERCRDARRVGILVGTLSVQSYGAAIQRMKRQLRNAGKRPYTILVGRLNVAKLANFSELDAYVLVACPESSIIDSREFLQPVLTPFELELACCPGRVWDATGRYVCEFGALLASGDAPTQTTPPDGDVTDVSLISGRLRWLGTTSQSSTDEGIAAATDGQLLRRDIMETVLHSNGAAGSLVARTWTGLEPRRGETPVTAAIEGSTGIAAGYVTLHRNEQST